MLPDQVLLADARLRYAGLVQPLDIVQAQALCVWTLLICSVAAQSGPAVPQYTHACEEGPCDA